MNERYEYVEIWSDNEPPSTIGGMPVVWRGPAKEAPIITGSVSRPVSGLNQPNVSTKGKGETI